jgi:glucan phosphoethanolaminetransferase (alkaline phosphatase superfamily)
MLKNIKSIFTSPALWFVVAGVILAMLILNIARAYVYPALPEKLRKYAPAIVAALIGCGYTVAHAAPSTLASLSLI